MDELIDRKDARSKFAAEGIQTMNPFSDFPFLKQGFTEGERWSVRAERLEKLKVSGLVTAGAGAKFASEGALRGHLETLQRKGRFKGFNQKSVSVIIAATDPRKQEAIHHSA